MLAALQRVNQRMPNVEKFTVAVQGGMGEGARNWIALDRRLKGLEAAVDRTNSGASAIEPIQRDETVNVVTPFFSSFIFNIPPKLPSHWNSPATVPP